MYILPFCYLNDSKSLFIRWYYFYPIALKLIVFTYCLKSVLSDRGIGRIGLEKAREDRASSPFHLLSSNPSPRKPLHTRTTR